MEIKQEKEFLTKQLFVDRIPEVVATLKSTAFNSAFLMNALAQKYLGQKNGMSEKQIEYFINYHSL